VLIYQALEKVGGNPEELGSDLMRDTLIEQTGSQVSAFAPLPACMTIKGSRGLFMPFLGDGFYHGSSDVRTSAISIHACSGSEASRPGVRDLR